MVDISSIAKQIASKLDKFDGNPDGMITAYTWNNIFNAEEKGGIKLQSEQISVFNAEKNIEQCLNNLTSSADEKNNIGAKWLDFINAREQNSKNAENAVLESKFPKFTFSDVNLRSFIRTFEPTVSTFVHKMPEVLVDTEQSFQRRTNAVAVLSQLSEKETIIENLIKQELVKKGINESNVDIPYWVERISKVSTKFNIPQEIIVSIISRENSFTKNVSNSFGKGAMALTGIAIKSFFPNDKGNWNNIYQILDNELLQDILYNKDSNGNLVKDANGSPILKYKSSQELLAACGKDDELSIKVGSLIFEMKYAEAIAEKKFGRVTYANLPKTIQQIQSGELTLTENENIACVGQAVRNYNGCSSKIKRDGKLVTIKDDYKREVMDSLKVQGYNFSEQNIIKRT